MRRLLRHAAPAAAAAAVVLAPSALPAAATVAAATPGWRIVQVLPNTTVGGRRDLGVERLGLRGPRH